MNKFVLSKKSSKTIQNRLLSIQPIDEKKLILKKVINIPSIIIPTFLLITLILTYIILFATSGFQSNGLLLNGEENLADLKAFETNLNFLGTGSSGRDNATMTLNSAITTTIDILFVLLFSIVLGTILNFILKKTNISRKYLFRYSALEGLITFPLFFLIASIFFRSNYWAIILLGSLPTTITFASKLEINLREWKMKNEVGESKIQNYFKTNNFLKVTLVKWAQTVFEIIFKGALFYIFWTSLFTYLGMLDFGFPYLFETTFSLGRVVEIAVEQVIDNPIFLLFISSVFLSVIGLLSIISSSIDIHIKGIKSVTAR